MGSTQHRRNDRTGLRPEVEQFLATARAGKANATGPTPVETLRTLNDTGAAYMNAGSSPTPLEREMRIDTPAASLRAVVYAPVPQPEGLPVWLHLHGGGFVFMKPESFARGCREIAREANVIVISLDYRLAPEHPYPTPLDDCVAAFRWLREHAAEIGGDPARIAIGGESAGGGLAASTTLRLLRDGDQPPAALCIACAWLDLRNATPSFRAFGPDDPLIDDAAMEYWRSQYAPDASQWDDPLLSPAAADVRGFPPTCIAVGEIDPLRDDGIMLAERVRDAGQRVELYEYEGMPHTFWCFPPLHGATDVLERMAAFLRRELHGGA